MNIRDLKYFVSTAKHGNFTKAAEECFVSQPTLSMQIKKLEGELGFELLERDKKKVMLTDAGRALLNAAEGIVTLEREIKEVAKTLRDPFAGKFRLGVFPTLAPYLLPKVVGKLHKHFPKLELVLVEEKTSVITEMLLNGKLDAGILALPLNEQKLWSIDLFEENFLLAVNKASKLAKLEKIKIDNIMDENILLLNEGHCLRDQALEFCQLNGAKEAEEYRGTSLETLRQMVAAGGGVTFIPQIAATPMTDIKYIRFAGQSPKRKIGLVMRRSTTRVKLLEQVAKVISDIMAKEKGPNLRPL